MKRFKWSSLTPKSLIKWLPLIGVIGLSLFPLQTWVRQSLVLVVLLWSIITLYLDGGIWPN